MLTEIGGNPAPATQASTTDVHTGHPAAAAATSAINATTCRNAVAASTTRGPRRSMSRPWTGLPMPAPTENAAAQVPASASDPVESWTTSTIPTGATCWVSWARKPDTACAPAPGSRNRSRYGMSLPTRPR